MFQSIISAALFCALQWEVTAAFSILPATSSTVQPLHYRVEVDEYPAPNNAIEATELLKTRLSPQEEKYASLAESFAAAKARGEAAFVSFVTAGYPTAQGKTDTAGLQESYRKGTNR